MIDQQPTSVWPFDIAVVGLGIVGSHQTTREVVEVIRRCEQTFVIGSGYGVQEYVETLCPRVQSLNGLYERGKSRMPTYRKMAAEVVSAAISSKPVCLAAYGHPWIYCYPTTLIQRAAAVLDLHVEVFAGVSAFDSLLVDLGVDIAFDGIQMFEATDLLLRRRPLQSDVTTIIWQATIVGDPTYPEESPTAAQFVPLQRHLLRWYPEEHVITLVTSKTHPLLRSVVQAFPLRDLPQELERSPQIGTLYIPPVRPRPVEDMDLLNQMLSAGATRMGVDSAPSASRAGRPIVGPQPPRS